MKKNVIYEKEVSLKFPKNREVVVSLKERSEGCPGEHFLVRYIRDRDDPKYYDEKRVPSFLLDDYLHMHPSRLALALSLPYFMDTYHFNKKLQKALLSLK